MIDVHLHVVPPNLPGVGSLGPPLEEPASQRAAILRAELATAGVTNAFAMGRLSDDPADPLGIAETLALAQAVPGLRAIGVANPTRADTGHLARVEAELAARKVCALKAYLGYLHVAPTDPVYRPYYELAARYKIPFVFHTGDTYSPRAKLRYAQPLLVDDVAVDHPETRFVLAHLGNPWLQDAAEVIYKNINVWADLSGLVVGTAERFESEEQQQTLSDTAVAVARAFRYAERPNRFLFGSDWPLVPIATYARWVQSVLPSVYHEQVFEGNAKQLFQV